MSRAIAAVTKAYKHFDNSDVTELTPSDAQSSTAQEPPHVSNGANAPSVTLDSTRTYDSNKISVSEIKERSRKLNLTRVQLGVSILILVLECVSTGLSSGSYWGFGADICHVGTGIWVGFMGIIGAVLGIVWIRRADRNAGDKRGFMMAYFVLSILQSFLDGILAMLATVCITQASAYIKYAKQYQAQFNYLVTKESHVAVVTLNAIMIVLAVLHIIANMLAGILICRTWWVSSLQKESQMTVIYVADNLTTARLPTLCIEKGSRVTFLPTQSTQSGGVPNGDKSH